jgi:hypothetical protein
LAARDSKNRDACNLEMGTMFRTVKVELAMAYIHLGLIPMWTFPKMVSPNQPCHFWIFHYKISMFFVHVLQGEW